MKMWLLAISSLLCSITFPPSLFADNACLTAFHETFNPPQNQFVEGLKLFEELNNQDSRLQRETFQRFMDSDFANAQEWAKRTTPGGKADPEQAWADYAREILEPQIIEEMRAAGRVKGIKYPSLERRLAMMASQSRAFRGGVMEFLNNGNFTDILLSRFRQRIANTLPQPLAKKFQSKVGTWGGYISERLINNRVSLPYRTPASHAEMMAFMEEISAAIGHAMNPNPHFTTAWMFAWSKGVRNLLSMDAPPQDAFGVFVDTYTTFNRAHFIELVNDVSIEAFGKPRPEVITQFARWGIYDTVIRRLIAAAIGLKEGFSESELVDGYGGYRKKFLHITKKMLDKNIAFRQEVQQLALELAFVTRPVLRVAYLFAAYKFAFESEPEPTACDLAPETWKEIAPLLDTDEQSLYEQEMAYRRQIAKIKGKGREFLSAYKIETDPDMKAKLWDNVEQVRKELREAQATANALKCIRERQKAAQGQ